MTPWAAGSEAWMGCASSCPVRAGWSRGVKWAIWGLRQLFGHWSTPWHRSVCIRQAKPHDREHVEKRATGPFRMLVCGRLIRVLQGRARNVLSCPCPSMQYHARGLRDRLLRCCPQAAPHAHELDQTAPASCAACFRPDARTLRITFHVTPQDLLRAPSMVRATQTAVLFLLAAQICARPRPWPRSSRRTASP
jgi:hypothetical protein